MTTLLRQFLKDKSKQKFSKNDVSDKWRKFHHRYIDKMCARHPVKISEKFNLLQTARDTSELKHSKLFSDVQSVTHTEIHIVDFKSNKPKQKKSMSNN